MSINEMAYLSVFHPESSRVRCAFNNLSPSPLEVDSTRIDYLSRAGRGAPCLSPRHV